MNFNQYKPITDKCKHLAAFLDDTGKHIGLKKLNYFQKTFLYKEHGYNFDPLNSTFISLTYWFSKTKIYFYHLNDPNPLKLDLNNSPVIDSLVFGSIIDSNVIKKLHDQQKDNDFFKKFLTPVNIVIFLIVVGVVIWFFMNGGIKK